MPNPSEEKTPGANVNYSEACPPPKEDIQRRKMTTISTMRENSRVYNSKYLTLSEKIRHFRVFAECIFLHNCELWTTTKTINDNIHSFHRRQLRYALGIKYPRVITNHQLAKYMGPIWVADVSKWAGHVGPTWAAQITPTVYV